RSGHQTLGAPATATDRQIDLQRARREAGAADVDDTRIRCVRTKLGGRTSGANSGLNSQRGATGAGAQPAAPGSGGNRNRGAGYVDRRHRSQGGGSSRGLGVRPSRSGNTQLNRLVRNEI